jgi:hypothetical protein
VRMGERERVCDSEGRRDKESWRKEGTKKRKVITITEALSTFHNRLNKQFTDNSPRIIVPQH